MNKREIHRSDFDTSIAERIDYKTREELEILENYTNELSDLNQLALGWSEDYTDIINLEDELANIKATFVNIPGYKTLLGGTPISFTRYGKTYRPELNGIEIKGSLKHKLVAHLTKGTQPKVVDISGTPAVKYIIQYANYGLEIYVFKNGNSFFKVFLSAQKNKTKNTIKRPKTFSHELEDKLDGNIFPEIEMDMIEKALDLIDELENLSYKSNTVVRVIDTRSNLHIAKEVEYKARIQALEDELAEYKN